MDFKYITRKVDDSFIEWPVIINSLLSGAQCNKVISFKTNRLTVESDVAIDWTADGEYGGTYTKVTVENIQKALPIILGPERSGLPLEDMDEALTNSEAM